MVFLPFSVEKENTMEQRIKIGVSACLLGEEVRYNGGHSHDRYITGVLAQYFTFVGVCPEVEAGFGIPRETLRLVGDRIAAPDGSSPPGAAGTIPSQSHGGKSSQPSASSVGSTPQLATPGAAGGAPSENR